MSFHAVKNPLHFPSLEKEVLTFWEEHDIFRKSIDDRPEEKPFTFFEGPPTANGRPGIHHVISRSVKDFVCRYKTMQGFRVIRKAGWDTHGLPVEIEVEKELGFETKDQIEAYGIDKFNQKCRDSVFKYLKEWNELTRRMGYWVDLDNPYITYTNEYIETVWHLLATMWKKDLLYLGFKILPYCPRCETALSSHETSLGYRDVTERSITAKFPLADGEDRYVLAWTTTPWTLPGNVALAVGPEILYAEVEQDVDGRTETYFLAEDRLKILKGDFRVVRTFPGAEMEGWTYRPLFDFVDLSADGDKAYVVATADFVTTDEGTGVVHTAVMYGEDDYRLGMRIGLPAVHTVDEKGCFNELVSHWQGRYVKEPELENEIAAYLSEKGRLYAEDQYMHTYPFCWRCDSPLLYYAKRSWYLRTTQIKDQLIANNKTIRWYPKEVGEGRFGQWLENNVDWALSRDRYWGTPLNIWICDTCEKQLAIESIQQLKDLSGLSDITELHKPVIDAVQIPCPACGEEVHRTPEVIDCWFDSGAMPYAQYHYPFAQDGLFERHFPADFIAEGIDQTRGWFYSLLAISTLISEKPSYKACVSIEMILDKDGQKMSKSKGNVVDPFTIMDEDGADPLRWYLFTVSPPWVPTRFDRDGIREVVRKFFGTLANTYSFFVLYANIDGFTYQEESIPVSERPQIDRWLLSTRNSLVRRINDLLSRYDVTKATREIQDFVIDDLSNWYVRRNRRRFWKSEMGSEKRAAYQTLYETLLTIVKLIAPFAPFLSEEMYRNLNSTGFESHESVHLADYPNPDKAAYQFVDEALEERMRTARHVVTLARSARNEAGIKVRQPLERLIMVAPGKRRQEAIRNLERLISDEVNVRQVTFTDEKESLVEKRGKPVFKNLGPKFGKEVNKAAEAIRCLSPSDIERLEAGEPVGLSIDGVNIGQIGRDDVEVETMAKSGLVVQSDTDVTIALDVILSDSLVAEGLAREFVNRIQNMRKEASFDVTDRIHLYFDATDGLRQAVTLKQQYIQEEVLAVTVSDTFQEGDFSNEWEIENEKVRVGIQRITGS